MKTTKALLGVLNGTLALAGRISAAWMLSLVLLLALPTAMQAQDFTFTTNYGTITITGYTGSGGAVTIPSMITGLPVTSIGYYAFYGETTMGSVDIPNTVTSVAQGAFVLCTGLAAVTMENSVTNIGGGAFADCTSLTNVVIPYSVTKIGDGPFEGCTKLAGITVDTLSSSYSSLDGVLFNKNQSALIQYPAGKAGSYVVPNSVTTIGNWAFDYCAGLTNVTIPNGVTYIGQEAFGYSALTGATIPASVTNIGYYALIGCTELTVITVDALNTTYSSVDGVLFNKDQTTVVDYPSGKAGNYALPSSVSNIGASAFNSCTSLTTITIPNSVTNIGEYAFAYCTNLTSLTIPNSVTIIGSYTFSGCISLTNVYFQGNAPSDDGSGFDGDSKATIYYLPGTIGWGSMFGGAPTALWSPPNPVILTSGPSFGLGTNGFGFIISWATNVSVVVEVSSELANPTWSQISANTLTGGSSYFSDPQWTNYPGRFYRLRSP